ncbi:MAG: hypothetical protein ACKOQ6_02345 [Bacteroidota bacterium]
MNKPPVNYGSQTHSLLCFAKMMRGPFTPDQARRCISGVFSGSRALNDARRSCKQLEKHGFLEFVGNDTWVINEDGRQVLFVIANYYRQYKEKLLGKRYMAMVNKQISDIRGSTISVVDLDIEDQVLDHVETKTKAAIKRQSAKDRKAGRNKKPSSAKK